MTKAKTKYSPLKAPKRRSGAPKLFRYELPIDDISDDLVADLKSYCVPSDERPTSVTSWFEDPRGKCIVRKMVASYPDGYSLTITYSKRGGTNVKVGFVTTIKARRA